MIGLLTLAIAAEMSGANPLSPAHRGMMQCYAPNSQAKTCRSLASYTRQGEGDYSDTVLMALPQKDMTLETTTPVKVTDGAVCAPIRAEDIAQGKLRAAGRLLASEDTKPVLDRIAASMAPLVGRQICTSYQASGTGLVAKVKIDGVYQAELDQVVAWVSPSDGYTVAP